MRRILATAFLGAAGLCAPGCGGAAESAEAATTTAKKSKVEIVVINRSGVELDQVGLQTTGARVSFDEMDRGETERVMLAEGIEPRNLSMSWKAQNGGSRYSASLSVPGGIGVVTITIDTAHRATVSAR